MFVSRWRGAVQVPSQCGIYLLQTTSERSTLAHPAICNHRFASSGSGKGVNFDTDFYETQIERSKNKPANKDLSIVRRLPKSALKHNRTKKHKDEKDFARGSRRKGQPHRIFRPKKQQQSETVFQDRQHVPVPTAKQFDAWEPKATKVPFPKMPMFREDWIKMRNDEVDDEEIGVRPQSAGKQTSKYQHKKKVAGQREFIDDFPPQKLDSFVSCLPGLEPYLKEELDAIGITCELEPGGATISQPLSVDNVLNCHLHLGTASHVLIRCGKPFTARGLSELKRKVARLPWERFVKKTTELQVRVSSKKSKLNHNTAIRTSIIEGINESFNRTEPNAEQAVSQARAGSEDALHMLVRVERDEVHISVDTSMTPLHRRMYRLETSKAPLREDIAFGMLYSAGWRGLLSEGSPGLSSNKSTSFNSLLDPFCGSGTIVIEAAAIAAGLPPGRLRPAPLNGTALFDPKRWRQLKAKAEHRASRNKGKLQKFVILGSDRDEGAICAAKNNAERAGIDSHVEFHCASISANPWLDNKNHGEGSNVKNSPLYPLLIATNPPFGMRISPDKQQKSRAHPLLPLYQTLIGRATDLKKSGHRVSAITLLQDVNVFRRTGVHFEVKFSSQHGGIPVAAIMADFQETT